jgi:hypothetical protein
MIGVLGFGTEAGLWYFTKQRAQNAADSAALSGALAIADSNSQSNFGTLNGFSSVPVTPGSYSNASGFLSGGTPVNAVQATVTQCEPQSLSLVFFSNNCTDANGKSHAQSVTITAQAVATVMPPQFLPCALALTGPVTFQDAAVQVNAPNCGIASNGTPIGINFNVTPKQLTVGSLSTAGGCSGSLCGSVTTYAPPVIDPFSALMNAMTNPSNLTLPPCPGNTFQSIPYATGLCAYHKTTINSATDITASGVYFFSGALKLAGNGYLHTCTGVGDPDPGCSGVTQQVSATIILLPGATLSMTGNSYFDITAPTTAPSASALPSQLGSGSVPSLLANMAIFDPETSPTIGGTSTMSGSGVFYFPYANPLNFQGNPTSSSTCSEVIAASINFSGTPNFDNSGCPNNIKLKSQVVALVQ